METKKQTALDMFYQEVFFDKITNFTQEQWNIIDKVYEQAKAMEKEQMKDAVLDDVADNENMKKKFADRFEQYYNETYNK